MVKYSHAAIFHALADSTRREILDLLRTAERSAGQVAERFPISQPAISKHLKVLERAGLISRGREAQRRPCRLKAAPMREAVDWLANYRDYWEESYQRLDALLDELQRPENEQ